jgi:hypothetical protein
MVVGPSPLCLRCVHFHEWNENGFTCRAFPHGIPDDIVYGGFNHNKPFRGDHGILFLPQVKFEITRTERSMLSPFARAALGRITKGMEDYGAIERIRIFITDIDRNLRLLPQDTREEIWNAFLRIIENVEKKEK